MMKCRSGNAWLEKKVVAIEQSPAGQRSGNWFQNSAILEAKGNNENVQYPTSCFVGMMNELRDECISSDY